MDRANSSICSPLYALAQLSFSFPWSFSGSKMVNHYKVRNSITSSKCVCFKVEMFVKLQRYLRTYALPKSFPNLPNQNAYIL